MGFRVDDHQSKLSENGEPQPGVAEGPADFAYQVGFAGRSYEFISAPFFHRRVELVVGPIRAAVDPSLIEDASKLSPPAFEMNAFWAEAICGGTGAEAGIPGC